MVNDIRFLNWILEDIERYIDCDFLTNRKRKAEWLIRYGRLSDMKRTLEEGVKPKP